MNNKTNPITSLKLTFDVEPFWATIPMAHSRDMWDQKDNNTDYWTNIFLEFCIENGFGAEFFVVGRWAKNNPNLIKKIHDAGFSIGSHSYWHEDLSTLQKAEFIEDVTSSKKLLEDIIGDEVGSFRAPSFSILSEQLLILSDAGYNVDSSTTDALRIYGGQADLNTPAKIKLVPFVGMKIAGKTVPVLGGGYMRILPEWFFKVNKHRMMGNMIYLHPVDLPARVDKMTSLSKKQNFRKRVRIGSIFDKILILNEKYEMTALECN